MISWSATPLTKAQSARTLMLMMYFLIQGEGKRRWQVVTDPDYPTDLLPDSQLAGLKVLNEFNHQ